MLDYNEFKEILSGMVDKKVEKDVKASILAVSDINGKIRDSMGFTDSENLLRPAVFLDSVYNQYLEGQDMSACVDFVVSVCDWSKQNLQNESYRNWKLVKDKINIAVLNREWNPGRWEKMPHFDFLDLVVYCRVIIEDDTFIAGAVVSNDMLEEWEIEENDLWDAAFANFKKSKFEIRSLTEVLKSYDPEGFEINDMDLASPLYMLTNQKQNMGAVGMLRIDLLEHFSRLCKCNWYILPSSTHEVLLTPDNGFVPAELKKIVQEVNRAQVSETERLSDTVYYYRRGSWKLEIAA